MSENDKTSSSGIFLRIDSYLVDVYNPTQSWTRSEMKHWVSLIMATCPTLRVGTTVAVLTVVTIRVNECHKHNGPFLGWTLPTLVRTELHNLGSSPTN